MWTRSIDFELAGGDIARNWYLIIFQSCVLLDSRFYLIRRLYRNQRSIGSEPYQRLILRDTYHHQSKKPPDTNSCLVQNALLL